MYRCEKCKKIFYIPEKNRPDQNWMHYSRSMIRPNTSLIDMCPNCRSTVLVKVGFIQPSISLSN